MTRRRTAGGGTARRTSGSSTGRRSPRGTGGAAATVAAVGLLALGGPASELGAQVSAARASAPRAAAPAAAPAPGPAADPAAAAGVPPVDDAAPGTAASAPPTLLAADSPVTPVAAAGAPGPAAGSGAGTDAAGTATTSSLLVPRPWELDAGPRTPFVPVGQPLRTEPRPEACGGSTTPRRVVPAVDPGPVPGSVVLTWQGGGRGEVLGYRVQAVSQRLVTGAQPPPPTALAGAPDACGPVLVTVTGLVPGDPYVFWLEEEVRDSLSVRWSHVGTTAAAVVR